MRHPSVLLEIGEATMELNKNDARVNGKGRRCIRRTPQLTEMCSASGFNDPGSIHNIERLVIGVAVPILCPAGGSAAAAKT